MDKNTSYKIIQDTLEGTFDKNKFLLFVKNLCNQIDESKAFQLSGAYIPDAFRGYIKSYERLGTFTDPEDKKIDVLIVYLQKDTSLERARTAQRNFVARYLKDRDQKDAGLVAFVSPNSEDWRFSLIKMEYKFTEGKSGKIKVKEEFTPARRWSFLVGANENSHTAQSRLAPILQDDEHNPTASVLEECFNIEKVTQEFFEKYRDLFLRVKETLDGIVKKDSAIRKDFDDRGVDTADFSKKLLGQIVFLYFLQKKGWFGVERDCDWGSGPKNFLRQLFEQKHGTYKNFFNDILEPLFYEALALERNNDFYSRFNCKIPFLNGGLFDPLNNYDWVHTDILMTNDLFSNNTKTKEGDIGDGILDVFDRYNFTVKEDEPLEKEVAIDPETLGKVFENLLAVKDRKSKGTYYTPREIVHYMCVQSLISYLAMELNGKVSKEDLERLIKYGETVGENEARVEEKGEETQTYHYKMPESVRLNAKLIDEKLSNIKVCDPAIGSGAFPVGMMTEIVRARNTLSIYLKDSDRTLYNFKRDCIQNSLYGVDVDPGAVEIAKLRLWLSLIVDEDDIKQIKPLPNLDYKIMQGNSLLEEFEGVRLFDEKLISATNFDKEKQIEELKVKQNNLSSEYIKLHQANKLTNVRKEEIDADLKKLVSQIKRLSQSEKTVVDNPGLFDIYSNAKKKADDLKRLHKEFFETTQKKKKDDLKKQIEKLEWELIEVTLKEQGKNSELKKLAEFKKANTRPFFLWKLHFAEVFQNGGFDVVTANPPYVDSETMTRQDQALRESYTRVFQSAKGNWDLFVIFIEKGLGLLRTDGVISYIVPNKLIAASYTEELRNMLKEKNIKEIRDFSKVRVFKEAAVYPIVFLAQNNNRRENVLMTLMSSETEIIYQNTISPDIFYKDINWDRFLSSDKILNLIFKLAKLQKLNTLCGEISGAATVSQAYEIKTFITEKTSKHEKFRKLVNTGTIDPYVSLWGQTKTQYIKGSYNFPIISDKDLKEVSSVRFRQACANKIIIGGMTKVLECFYDEGECLAGKSTTIILETDQNKTMMKYVLALLNSKLISCWYQNYFTSLKLAGGYLRINNKEIGQIPIVIPSSQDKDVLTEMVEKILGITKSMDYLTNDEKQTTVRRLKHQIDMIVYELYELSPTEIEMVENSSTKKL